MSEEKDATEATDPEESEPERKFSQEHYDRLDVVLVLLHKRPRVDREPV